MQIQTPPCKATAAALHLHGQESSSAPLVHSNSTGSGLGLFGEIVLPSPKSMGVDIRLPSPSSSPEMSPAFSQMSPSLAASGQHTAGNGEVEVPPCLSDDAFRVEEGRGCEGGHGKAQAMGEAGECMDVLSSEMGALTGVKQGNQRTGEVPGKIDELDLEIHLMDTGGDSTGGGNQKRGISDEGNTQHAQEGQTLELMGPEANVASDLLSFSPAKDGQQPVNELLPLVSGGGMGRAAAGTVGLMESDLASGDACPLQEGVEDLFGFPPLEGMDTYSGVFVSRLAVGSLSRPLSPLSLSLSVVSVLKDQNGKRTLFESQTVSRTCRSPFAYS